MHDCALQAEYIRLGDSANGKTADDLADLYLEYEHVERYKRATTLVKQNSQWAKQLSNSRLRAPGEINNQTEFDRVKANYLDKNQRPRGQWYVGDGTTLARKVGREEEYFWFTSILHSSIHGGPFASRNGPPYPDAKNLLQVADALIRRLLVVVIKVDNLILSEQSTTMMNATVRDILNPN
ncbi:MAG: hypothetical protein KF691_08560 [Phycisphaeraceae bacterium]|nr:hypothetical protein [Phycisphaeraceae bacterium]